MEELKQVIDQVQSAFEQFKAVNDERLAQIEKKGYADPLVTEHVEKLNARITELENSKTRLEDLEKKVNRRPVSGEQPTDALKQAHKTAFYDGFIRKGHTDGLAELEQKSMNITTPAAGGFAVPEDLDRTLLELARHANVMRTICNGITVGTSDYRKLVNLGGTAAAWVGEQAARPATAAPTFAQLTPTMGELYANPQATQQCLDDVFFNVEAFLVNELAAVFEAAEEAAFVAGDGVNKPQGFLAHPVAATVDGVRPFGTLQALNTGSATGFLPSDAAIGRGSADVLVDVVYALKAAHRAGAQWLAPKLTYAVVRKLKDAEAGYVWQPSLQAGVPATLLGYPAQESEAMPAMASGAFIMAFGNFKKGYQIVDRIGTRMLRDPYTHKPFVGFYTVKRVGGMLMDSEAIKILRQAI